MGFRALKESMVAKRQERFCAHLRSIGLDAQRVVGREAEEHAGFKVQGFRSPGGSRDKGYHEHELHASPGLIEIRNSPIGWVVPTATVFYLLVRGVSLSWSNIGYVAIKSVHRGSSPLIRWEGEGADHIIRLLNTDTFLGEQMVRLKLDVTIYSYDIRWVILGTQLRYPSRQVWDCYERIARDLVEAMKSEQLGYTAPAKRGLPGDFVFRNASDQLSECPTASELKTMAESSSKDTTSGLQGDDALWEKIKAKFVEKCMLLILLLGGVVGLSFVLKWAELRHVASTPGSIVFKTGGGSIFVTAISIIVATAIAYFGIWLLRGRWETINVKLSRLFGSALLAFGVLLFYASCYWLPTSECVVIDKVTKTINTKKYYILRAKTEFQVPFADIRRIKFQYGVKTLDTSIVVPYGIVKVVTSDGSEVRISGNGRKYQYKLAKAISHATGKELTTVGK